MPILSIIFFVGSLAIISFLFYQVVYNDKLKKGLKIFFWVIIITFSLAFYPLILLVGNYTLPGKLDNFAFYHAQGNDILVFHSVVTQGTPAKGGSTDKFISLDLHTGKVLADLQGLTAPDDFYLAQSGTVLWFYDRAGNALEGRDPVSLAVVANEKELIAKNPQLKAGLSSDYYALDTNTDDLILLSQDGNYFEIDPKTFLVTQKKESDLMGFSPINLEDNNAVDYKNTEVILADKSVIQIDNDTRGTILKKSGESFQPLGPNGGLTYLDGSLLDDSSTSLPLEMSSPESFFVIHKNSVDDQTESLLARVSVGGKTLWEKSVLDPTGDDFVEGVHLVNNSIIVVTNQTVSALNGADGSVQWTMNF